MESFFTLDHPYDPVFKTWIKTKKEMEQRRLAPYADLLYKAIRDSIFARRAEIHATLLSVAATSTDPTQLRTPLWSYVGAECVHYDKDMLTRLRDDGYDWSVSWAGPGMTQVSVNQLVKATDLRERIACLFDATTFRVTADIRYEGGEVSHGAGYTSWNYDLVLHWYPKGVPAHIKARNLAAQEKHAGREIYGSPDIYKGIAHEVGFSNRTPPPRAAAAAPPPLGRRTDMWQRSTARQAEECPTERRAQELGFSVDDFPVCYCQTCEPDYDSE